MRQIVVTLLILPVLLFGSETIILSPYNLGEGWRARNDSMLAHLQVKYGNPLYGTVNLWFWDTYTYACSDSAFALYDMFSDSTIILKRFIEPPNCDEVSPIESNWINITKSSPLKTFGATATSGTLAANGKITLKGYKFNGWGPHGRVKPLSEKDKWMAKDYFKTLKGRVDDMLVKHGNKAWKDKDGKVIAKKDKRRYAWLDVTGKGVVKFTGKDK